MVNARQLKSLLSDPRKCVIIMHHKPDADALGSSLGLAAYLKKGNHDITVISPSDYPEFLEWMSGNTEVIVFHNNSAPNKGTPSHRALANIAQADIIFCLDFSSLARIHELGDPVRQSPARKVLIDHHLEPERFADFEQWDDSAASTAELVYRLICELGDEHLIDTPIAECLYAGLLTDTGGFRHNNTNQNSFNIAGKLVSYGANPHKISKLIYDNNTLERLRLMGFVLNEKLQVLPEYCTAYITLTKEELKRYNSQTGDTEGLVNFGLSVKGIVMSALIYERKDGTVKLSFRSLSNFSVNDFARKHFQGGGHKNAAGGQTELTLDQALQKFIELLDLYKEQLNIVSGENSSLAPTQMPIQVSK